MKENYSSVKWKVDGASDRRHVTKDARGTNRIGTKGGVIYNQRAPTT